MVFVKFCTVRSVVCYFFAVLTDGHQDVEDKRDVAWPSSRCAGGRCGVFGQRACDVQIDGQRVPVERQDLRRSSPMLMSSTQAQTSLQKLTTMTLT
jgi:hypothetical protein